MKFDKILQYQKIDQEVNALTAEMSKSDAYQNYQESQNKYESAKSNIGRLTTEAGELLKSYETMKSKIDAIRSELAEFDGILEEVQDVNEAEYYLKLVSAISDKLASLEKEANGVSAKIEQVNSAYTKTWAQGVKATQAVKTAKAEYNKFAETYKEKYDALKKQLNALMKEIPEELMSTYNRLKKSQKLPVFVAFDSSNKVCGRCRTEVSNDVCAKLKNAGDYAECPNCRRILFVPEN